MNPDYTGARQVRVPAITDPRGIDDADLVILPGSKHVTADLAWLRESGLAAAVKARAESGGRVLGICGGLQMLGERLDDPAGVDGSGVGLGLLPVVTTFATDKVTRHLEVRFRDLPGPWQTLGNLAFAGYEIRHGRTSPPDTVIASGPVLGVSAHGMLESPEVLSSLFGTSPTCSLDDVFDALADAVETHLDTHRLDELAGMG